MTTDPNIRTGGRPGNDFVVGTRVFLTVASLTRSGRTALTSLRPFLWTFCLALLSGCDGDQLRTRPEAEPSCAIFAPNPAGGFLLVQPHGVGTFPGLQFALPVPLRAPGGVPVFHVDPYADGRVFQQLHGHQASWVTGLWSPDTTFNADSGVLYFEVARKDRLAGWYRLWGSARRGDTVQGGLIRETGDRTRPAVHVQLAGRFGAFRYPPLERWFARDFDFLHDEPAPRTPCTGSSRRWWWPW